MDEVTKRNGRGVPKGPGHRWEAAAEVGPAGPAPCATCTLRSSQTRGAKPPLLTHNSRLPGGLSPRRWGPEPQERLKVSATLMQAFPSYLASG